tara:strand:+ start:218 stop:436 length:219 start_codon:yes stop_codon:yes gene_type:complete
MKREVGFELDLGIEVTLVYYITEYPEGTYVEVDWLYYQSGKDKHNMSFLLEDKRFYEYMQEIASEDSYELMT